MPDDPRRISSGDNIIRDRPYNYRTSTDHAIRPN